MKIISQNQFKYSNICQGNFLFILFSPTVFIKFLEYLLRYNPPVNYEIKNGMYFVMNNINDDFAKNSISGLLDFIFNM